MEVNENEKTEMLSSQPDISQTATMQSSKTDEIFSLDENSSPTKDNMKDTPPSVADQKPKSKKEFTIIGAIIVLIVLAVAAGYYLLSPLTPKKVFDLAIEDMYKMAKDIYDPANDGEFSGTNFLEKNLSANLNGTFTLFANGQTTSYGLNSLVEMSKSSKELSTSIELSQDEQKVLDFDIYRQNKKAYIQSKKLFPKIFDLGEIDYEIIDELDELEQDDTFGLITATKDYLLENMKEEDFSQSNDTLLINGTDNKVIKYTYTMTSKVSENLFKGYADYIDNLVKSNSLQLSSKTRASISELKNANYDNFETLQIDLYASRGKNIYGFDIEKEGVKLIRFYYLNGKLEAAIRDEDEDSDVLWFMGETISDKLNIDIYGKANEDEDEKRYATIVIEESNEHKIEISYTIDAETDTLEGTLSIETESQKSDDDITFDYEITFSVGTNDFDAEINLNYTLCTIDNVNLPSFDDTAKIEDLTEEDYESIFTNFENAVTGTDFEFVLVLLDSLNANYDLDDDYDYSDNF